MSTPIISVENLSKAYRVGAKDEMPDTLVGAAKGMLTAPLRNLRSLRQLDTAKSGKSKSSEDTLWALKDVSFEINRGDVVGVIGHNGAGKSTLLKILSRITEPTEGRAVVRGRVSSLLEVGTGFHPELTGRENVYMNGTILGMTKKEIDRKFDEIVSFSGIGKFLDTPTKRYSSGMQVRLAFAVAAHLEPEILIIDEVLAVGDVEFQRKCLGKMHEVARGGRTVVFVSHNMTAVETLCTSCHWMELGQVKESGETGNLLRKYFQSMNERSQSGAAECSRMENGFQCCRVQLRDQSSGFANVFDNGDEVTVDIDLKFELPDIPVVQFGLDVFSPTGVLVGNWNNRLAGVDEVVPSSMMNVKWKFGTAGFTPGNYIIGLRVKDPRSGRMISRIENAASFEVLNRKVAELDPSFGNGNGFISLNARIEVESVCE
ncbi:ABC transporter ATP-binding protein [Stieleria sp. JC731]|uniref:ABC transporter ATP-binding protein n=1 Tax=Pirellulaceae TaxID=2691357 RepID=UPI001E4F757D|nr:ABC transporter ATP-binding protein [Stieleria sp. JC731]MCC9601449.1 ABC transporter ATP-binding protein [Stieleria sp. JC731]